MAVDPRTLLNPRPLEIPLTCSRLNSLITPPDFDSTLSSRGINLISVSLTIDAARLTPVTKMTPVPRTLLPHHRLCSQRTTYFLLLLPSPGRRVAEILSQDAPPPRPTTSPVPLCLVEMFADRRSSRLLPLRMFITIPTRPPQTLLDSSQLIHQPSRPLATTSLLRFTLEPRLAVEWSMSGRALARGRACLRSSTRGRSLGSGLTGTA